MLMVKYNVTFYVNLNMNKIKRLIEYQVIAGEQNKHQPNQPYVRMLSCGTHNGNDY